MMLAAPLPGQEKREPTPQEIEADGAAFMALMAQHQTVKEMARGS